MKIRRAAVIAAAAIALALIPTVAQAYGADDYTDKGTVSDTTPSSGTSFTVTVDGPADADVVLTITSNPSTVASSTMTIAGTKALTKTTSAAGSAVFTVTLVSVGVYTLVATDAASGVVLSTQTVTIAAPSLSATDADAGVDGLSTTGTNALPIALGAGALVLIGAGGVVVARRRHATTAA